MALGTWNDSCVDTGLKMLVSVTHAPEAMCKNSRFVFIILERMYTIMLGIAKKGIPLNTVFSRSCEVDYYLWKFLNFEYYQKMSVKAYISKSRKTF